MADAITGRVFRDAKGRDWTVEVNCFTISQVMKATGVNLALFPVDDETNKFLADPLGLCKTLWAIVADQAATIGVSERDFGEAIYGDSLGAGADALADAIVDFHPPASQETLRNLLSVGREVQRAGAARLTELLDDPKLLDSILEQAAAEVKVVAGPIS